jgi:hypothetical protein
MDMEGGFPRTAESKRNKQGRHARRTTSREHIPYAWISGGMRGEFSLSCREAEGRGADKGVVIIHAEPRTAERGNLLEAVRGFRDGTAAANLLVGPVLSFVASYHPVWPGPCLIC